MYVVPVAAVNVWEWTEPEINKNYLGRRKRHGNCGIGRIKDLPLRIEECKDEDYQVEI